MMPMEAPMCKMSFQLPELPTLVFPHQVFFEPKQKFIEYLRSKRRFIVDAGAGVGHLAKLLGSKSSVLSIDLHMRDGMESPVITTDSTIFKYPKGSVVVIARPCHGDWIEDTVRRALGCGCAEVLIIGRPSTIMDDLEPLDDLRPVKVMEDAGKDGESVFSIKKCRRVPKCPNDYVLVNLRSHGKPAWFMDRGDGFWHNMAGGRCPKSDDDVIVKTAKAEAFEDLDWSGTFIDLDYKDTNAGWLARSGKCFGCQSQDHDAQAYYLHGKEVSQLEDTGWVRIYDSEKWVCKKRLTAEQRNWLLGHGFKVRDDD